jgi:hypothetical protein
MKRARWTIAITTGMALAINQPVAAQQIGEATLIKTTVTGDSGTLMTRSPVHRDERIRTSEAGLGEFVFRDGTKFAVGRNSSIVFDKFVFDDNQTAKTLTIKAGKGVFRWISGNSEPSAYKIMTPAGTLGIRGTALDVYIAEDGTTAVVLLKGEARFCGMNKDGCRELTQACDYVVATPDGYISEVKQADESILQELGTRSALPFQTGDQELSEEFDFPSCLVVAGGGSGGLASLTIFGIAVVGGVVCGAICEEDKFPVSEQ